MGEACNEPIVASLRPVESNWYSPRLSFVSGAKEAVVDAKLGNNASTKERCMELQNHFSGAPIKDGAAAVPNEFSLDIGFSPTAEQEQQMLLGKSVNIRPAEASLVLTDGSLNSASADLELRCPGSASVSCRVKDLGGYKKCDAYDVTFTGNCSFSSKVLLYNFSDHKKAQLEVMGELKTSEHGDYEIRFTTLSWLDID